MPQVLAELIFTIEGSKMVYLVYSIYFSVLIFLCVFHCCARIVSIVEEILSFTLKAETFACRKKSEIFCKNFRSLTFWEHNLRRKLLRIVQKPCFCVKKLSRLT